MIEIKDINGNIRFTTAVNEGCVHTRKLMGDDHIELNFNAEQPVQFERGDYIVWQGRRYELTDTTYPTYNASTGSYTYQLRLDAYYLKWKNKRLFYDRHGNREASWHLTRTPDAHLSIVCSNLKSLGYLYNGKEFTFSIDASVDMSAKVVSYNNTSIIDGLTLIAEKWEAEWWVEDNVIHLGRCEYNTAVSFELGRNVESMTRSESNDNYATRIYAFGSTRNLPANYRKNSDVVVDGVVQKRLMLPADTPHIDAYPDMPQEKAVEGIVVFEDVYPRRVGTMSSVNGMRFKDTGITFLSKYLMKEELRIVFTSGPLNGMNFGVAFNPDKEDESTPEAQVWEIVPNEDYGTKLPNATYKPANGDTYILYGFDSTAVSTLYLPAAEKELKERAIAYMAKCKENPSVFDCTMNVIDLLENNIDLNVGDRVKLMNPAYFDTDGYTSRIFGYSKQLDGLKVSYTVGNTAKYSRLASIENEVKEIVYQGNAYLGSGAGVYVIGRNDTTQPTERNVFSALRSLEEIEERSLSRLHSDEAAELIRFLKGILLGEDGSKITVDPVTGKSIAILGEVASDLIQSKAFTEGALGTGFVIRRDAKTGKSYIEVDELFVRRTAHFVELVIEKLSHVGGQIILTPSRMKCNRVEDLKDRYRCFFEQSDDNREITNDFVKDDQARCQTFNIKEGTSHNVSNQYYWRLVIGTGNDYIDLSKSDCDTGSTVPQAGDEIVQLGNRSFAERQNAIILSAYGSDAPSIKQYAGINSYSLSGKEVTVISPSGNKFKGDFNLVTGENIGKELEKAHREAEQAQKDATDAASRLNKWADDGIISPTEKQALKNEQAAIRAERSETLADAQKYAINTTNYINAFNAYDADLTYYTKEIPESITILPTFAQRQKAYYAARSAILDAIANAVKTYVNTTAKNEAGAVRTELMTEISAVPGKITLAVSESKDYTNKEISNIQVGGINLLANSKNLTLSNAWRYISGLKDDEEITVQMWGEGTINCYMDTGYVWSKNITAVNKYVKHTYRVKPHTGHANSNGTVLLIITCTNANIKVERGNKATDWSAAPQDTQADINKAKQDAGNAQNAANTAQSSANTANGLLADIANDNKLTANEKQQTKKEWDIIVSEYSKNITQAGKFGVPTTAYTSSYNVLSSYITPLLSNSGTTSDINGSTFRATFKAYYDARTDLLNAVSVKAKELADQAQTDANNAQKEAEKVRTEYQSDFTILGNEIRSKVSQVDFNALGQRVSSAESTIQQLPNQITFAVSEIKDYTNQQISNIKVGGINLLPNSKNLTLSNTWRYISGLKDDEEITVQMWGEGSISCFKDNGFTGGVNLIPANGYGKVTYNVKPYTSNANNRGTVLLIITCTNANIKVERGNKATDWSAAPQDIEENINQAKQDAGNAQNAANTAQSSANAANSVLADIASDNKLTAGEKLETMREWTAILSEYPKNVTQAVKFNVSATVYTTAYNTLNGYITPLLANLGTTSDINGTTFRTTFKAYYNARTDLLNAVSVKAKELADQAQTDANTAQKEAEKVRTEYQSDFTILGNEIRSKVSQVDFNALGQRVSSAESTIQQLPNQITLAVSNIQVGVRNLLLKSNIIRNTKGYKLGSYNLSKPLEIGKVYTLTICYKIGVNNTFIQFFQDSGYTFLWNFTSKTETVESRTFTFSSKRNEKYITVFQLPNGIHDSYIKWAVLIEGNKSLSDWTPAPEDTDANIDNIKIGGINLLPNSKNLTLSNAWRYISGLKDDEEITVQMWGEGSISCFKDNGFTGGVNLIPANGYGKVTYKVKPYTSNANNRGTVLLIITCTNANIKVERGNKATDWSAAPQDIEADLAERPTTNAIKAGITIEPGGINVFGQQLSFNGKVTFASLDTTAQNKVNAAQSAAETANSNLADLKGNLKSLAYLDTVELAKLGSTVIEGGYLKTNLINADKIITRRLETHDSGKRILIDPVKNSFYMYNERGLQVVRISFFSDSSIPYSKPRINLRDYDASGALIADTIIDAGTIRSYSSANNYSTEVVIRPTDGITFYNNGLRTKNYPTK